MRLVDLFCGTGGFARGAERAGFDVSLAVDIDPNLTFSHKHNFPNTKLLLENIEPMTGDRLLREAGGQIDGIFGGPPCQGFSSIGRRDPSDKRRKLLGHFFRLVSETEPSFFVMENVRGLLESTGRGELDDGLKWVTERYHVADPQVWDASEFGAATRRKRIFVIGTHRDKLDPVTAEDIEAWRAPAATVENAISDLAAAEHLTDDDEGFDLWKTNLVGRPNAYLAKVRSKGGLVTSNRATIHKSDVAKRFSKVVPGAIDIVGRHPRLDWSGQCPTLRAGTGADKGSYQAVRPLHPAENRVITVREAARLQGFPDRHRFHPTVWHSFRMIGNSVAPLMAEAIFRAINVRIASAGRELHAAE